MESKLLYEQGNLYSGDPYGVKVFTGWFGSFEIHGAFGTENEAHNYAVKQVNERFPQVTSAEVVKLETPPVGEKLLHSEAS